MRFHLKIYIKNANFLYKFSGKLIEKIINNTLIDIQKFKPSIISNIKEYKKSIS